MIHRMPGETLAISDSVAMIPTVQPAAAGTHEYREAGRVNVAVIGREDIRSNLEMVVTGRSYQTGPVYFSPGPWPGSSGAALASRNANCSDFSPSRTGPAWGPPCANAARAGGIQAVRTTGRVVSGSGKGLGCDQPNQTKSRRGGDGVPSAGKKFG